MKCMLKTSLITGMLVGVLNTPAFAVSPGMQWDASSGLTPDQVGYQLLDSASPEDPVLAGGVLTLSTDSAVERLYYQVDEPGLLFPATIEVSFRMRYASGLSTATGRAPAGIYVTTAPDVGSVLYVGSDEIFLDSGSIYGRGPENTSIDTDSMFHDYLLRIDGTASGSAVEVYQDGNLVLSGLSNTSFASHGGTNRIAFGDNTSLAYGTSEWQSFSHNVSLVPEPSVLATLGLGSLVMFALQRSRRRP